MRSSSSRTMPPFPTAARAASNWELFELSDDGAVKHNADARIDLGGIAKGYAIDRAAAVKTPCKFVQTIVFGELVAQHGIPPDFGGM